MPNNNQIASRFIIQQDIKVFAWRGHGYTENHRWVHLRKVSVLAKSIDEALSKAEKLSPPTKTQSYQPDKTRYTVLEINEEPEAKP
jgi:hypothetical protein